MEVPENYVKSKCCHAYQDPSNTVCVRCSEPFQAEEASEQSLHPTGLCPMRGEPIAAAALHEFCYPPATPILQRSSHAFQWLWLSDYDR